MEDKNEKKKSSKKFVIFFIIFLVFLVLLTASAIYITIKYIDKEVEISLSTFEDEGNSSKKQADDKKYALTSYAETYNENSLLIEKIDDEYITYFQIKGLKDKDLEDKINKRIKNEVYTIAGNTSFAHVTGNFSNILSVAIYGTDQLTTKEKVETINIDLSTGEDIKFEDVFVSSAPLNMYLADALYENLAWNVPFSDDNDFDYDKAFDMNYRDTSDYEDKFLQVINKYKKEKDNIKFTISPEGVHIYKLTEGITENDFYASEITIRFLEYLDQVAIYKRYLTDESIFEDDSIGQKNIIIFTDNSIYSTEDYLHVKYYGKLTNNIFLEEVINSTDFEYEDGAIKEFIDDLSSKKIEQIKKETKEDQGVIYQIEYNVWFLEESNCYEMSVFSSKATCTKEYFKNDAFKDFIKMKNVTMGDASMILFNEYASKDELKIKNEYKKYRINTDGEVIELTDE